MSVSRVPSAVHAALFSGVGDPPLRPLVEAARGWLPRGSGGRVVYLPAASTAGTYMALTVAAFEGVATVELVGVATGWAPDRDDVDRVRTADLLYVPGGNTYVLGERLHRSGLLGVLRERVLAGVPLLTFSAGTVLCGPTIVSTNDWNVVESSCFEGLGILPVPRQRPLPGWSRGARAAHRAHPTVSRRPQTAAAGARRGGLARRR